MGATFATKIGSFLSPKGTGFEEANQRQLTFYIQYSQTLAVGPKWDSSDDEGWWGALYFELGLQAPIYATHYYLSLSLSCKLGYHLVYSHRGSWLFCFCLKKGISLPTDKRTRGDEKEKEPEGKRGGARRKKMWLWMTSFTLFFIPHVFFPYSQPFGIFIQKKKKKKKTPTAFLVIIMNSSFPRDV